MNTLREVIRWVWWIVAIADCMASLLIAIEMRRRPHQAWRYLERPQFGEVGAAARTVVGLYLFGVNVQAHLWFLFAGLFVAIYQGWASVGLLLYLRNILNGQGWGGLFKSLLPRKRTRSAAS